MSRSELHIDIPWYIPLGEEILSSSSPDAEVLSSFIHDGAYSYTHDQESHLYIDSFINRVALTPETEPIITLYQLYSAKQQERAIRLDSSIMEFEVGIYYIGGIPLTHQGQFTLLPGFQGTVSGRFGGEYTIKCDYHQVEINLKGRKGQQTNEPGYFKTKQEDRFAESIVVTKEPGNTLRDPNLRYGHLLQYLLDNYPFSTGPVGIYRGQWLSGDNATAKSKEEQRLYQISKCNHPLNVLCQETSGTPLESMSPNQIYNLLLPAAMDDMAYRSKYHIPTSVTSIEEKIVTDLINTISVWKTPTGRVLQHRLGFDQVGVQSAHPYFTRNIGCQIIREAQRLAFPFINP